MSTTVTYKGSTLTTVSNETRILTTQGKYLEDNITLVDVTSGGGSGDGYVWQDQDGYVHLSDEQGTQTIVEPLSVTQNGTYTASTGHAYSPVTVSVSGGSGGGITADEIAMRTISGVISGSATYISSYAFYGCYSITDASFPSCSTISNYAFYNCASLNTAVFTSCKTIGQYAFTGCSNLTTASFPSCTYVSSYAFSACSKLTTTNFDACETVASYAFYRCASLSTISLPKCKSIVMGAFSGCYNLLSVYLLGSSIPTFYINAFTSTPISDYTTSTGGVYGSIFVPSSLYNSYITATGWSAYSSRFVSV